MERGSGRLRDKAAVVVGAGQTPGATLGNGRAVSLAFAREGARLLLVDRHRDSLEETAAMVRDRGGEAHVVVADVAADDGPAAVIAAALAALGRIDVLHNNVGIGAGDGPPHRLDDEVFDRIMDVNLRAMFRTCREAVPPMRAAGGGSIVNISSVAATLGAGNLTAYKISKAGVNALTQNLALTNAKHGIRVNAIMPGLIDTPMAVDALARSLDVDRDAVAGRRAAQVPLGRQGTAWEVAAAAVFLASDEASFVTGVILPVDGGQSLRAG